jgi:hypothetical protein
MAHICVHNHIQIVILIILEKKSKENVHFC